MSKSNGFRRLLPLLYAGGILLILDQAFDLAATLVSQPVDAGSPEWRFGAVGLLVTRTSVLLVGDVLLFAGAIALGHRRVLRLLGGLHLALGTLLVAVLVVFILDAVQVRTSVRPESRRAFDLAALRALLLTLTGAVLLGWAGLTALRASRRPREEKDPRLIVGMSDREART